MKRLKLQQLSLPTVELFLKLEEEILMNAARRLRREKGLLDEDIQSWQLDKLNQLGALTQENIITLAKHSHLAIDEVSELLKQAGYEAVSEIDIDLIEGVRRGILARPAAIEESQALLQVLDAFENHSRNWINMVNTTMLNQTRQQYLNVVNEVTAKVLGGTATPRQALRQAAAQWADMGIPAMIDKAGRTWSTEGYINMITRTVSNNVVNEMQDVRMDEYEVDLVEVSSHIGARPLCAPYQGRIFSRSGRNPHYTALEDTSIGEAAGLFGINCNHIKYPYVPGITEKRYEPYALKENDRIYEESQKQRYLERQIRKGKREYNMMTALDDKEGQEKAKQKILQRQANMRRFIDETGRTRRNAREQLPVNNPHVRGRVKE
jgi:hypothetical protein